MELEEIYGDGVVAEPPLRLDDTGGSRWDEQADVVVVGFGGAGAAAALEASERGADVLIAESFEGGGATAYSGGVFYAGGGTAFQKAAGVQDTAQDMFDYLSLEVEDAVSADTLRRFCEGSVGDVEWLVRHGVGFEGSLYSGKTNYPPEDRYLYYSGNEKVPAFARRAKAAARGHRTKGRGWTGYAFFDALKRSVYSRGIRVRTHSRAVRLIQNRSGEVVGVEVVAVQDPANQRKLNKLYRRVNPTRPFNGERAERAIREAARLEQVTGVRRRIRARRGIVLATGGYAYNLPMVGRHMPFLAQNYAALMRLGSMGCRGGGIQLGLSVGGSAEEMERWFLGRMIAPPDVLVQGLMVNKLGRRFINEDAYNARLGDGILRQPGGDAWLVIDREMYWTLLRQCIPTGDGTFVPYLIPALLNLLLGGTKKAATVRALAEKIGVDATALEDTVREVNAAALRGDGDVLGKHSDHVRPLRRGPYRALNNAVHNKYSFCIFFTLGGLRVDEDTGCVLRTDGSSIQGLYAAGRTAMGIPSNGYISGLSLADCVFSGRRAGRAVAARVAPVR